MHHYGIYVDMPYLDGNIIIINIVIFAREFKMLMIVTVWSENIFGRPDLIFYRLVNDLK